MSQALAPFALWLVPVLLVVIGWLINNYLASILGEVKEMKKDLKVAYMPRSECQVVQKDLHRRLELLEKKDCD